MTETPAEPVASTGTTRWQKVVGVLGLVVVLSVGNNLFQVVTSAGNRHGGPPGDPPASRPHTPSNFNH